MRDALIIFFAIIIALVVGGYLYLNGAPSFGPQAGTGTATTGDGTQPSAVTAGTHVLEEGQDAVGIDTRKNYRITNDADYDSLWSLANGTTGPVRPYVDFTKSEVIAVFDGSHTTGGYNVEVTEVKDADGVRTIHIRHTAPGQNCAVTQSGTSPFQILQVEKTFQPVNREEEDVTVDCS